MNKLNTLISGVLILLGIAFIGLIVFVSILGDNHKINFLVTQFFNDLKSHNYTQICQAMGDTPASESFGGNDPCPDFGFVLEMAFLTRFNLLDKNDYSVEIKRDHFWIPYLTDDRVRISIAFSEKKKNIIDEFLNGVDSNHYVQDFMLVERRNGAWVIADITLSDSSLYPLFNELKGQIDLDRFVRKTDQGFMLKENDIRSGSLNNLDQRLLEYSLFKLSEKK